MASFHSFWWLSNIPLYVYTISSLSISPWTLGSFHTLAIVHIAAINTGGGARAALNLHFCEDTQRHSSSGKYKSKPQWDATLHLVKWLKLTQKTTGVGEDVEKGEPSYAVGGDATGTATLENSMEVLKKLIELLYAQVLYFDSFLKWPWFTVRSVFCYCSKNTILTTVLRYLTCNKLYIKCTTWKVCEITTIKKSEKYSSLWKVSSCFCNRSLCLPQATMHLYSVTTD